MWSAAIETWLSYYPEDANASILQIENKVASNNPSDHLACAGQVFITCQPVATSSWDIPCLAINAAPDSLYPYLHWVQGFLA